MLESGAEGLEPAEDGPALGAEARLLQLLPHVVHRLLGDLNNYTRQTMLAFSTRRVYPTNRDAPRNQFSPTWFAACA